MVEYKCDRCNKIYSNKFDYCRHLNRKNPCEKKDLGKNILKPGEIIMVNDQLKCPNCMKTFSNIFLLNKHLKLICQIDIRQNNIYDLDPKTFGKNIFFDSPNSGDIYIIQNDFNINININLNDLYKIGVTINLNTRTRTYRCGNAYEPRLRYYFPCKDIKLADQMLKEQLFKYKIKREIFQGNLEEMKNIILNIVSKINENYSKVFEPQLKNDICSCEFCKKIFINKKDLIVHLKICGTYGKRKLDNDDESVSNNSKYLCNYCNNCFSTNSNMHKHIKKCQIKLQNFNEKKKEEILKNILEKLVNVERQNTELRNEINQNLNLIKNI